MRSGGGYFLHKNCQAAACCPRDGGVGGGEGDGSPRCGVGQLRDVRFKPGEHFFTMKPLAPSDSNGVPSQQDKPPVSSQSRPLSIFFLSLRLLYEARDMITTP